MVKTQEKILEEEKEDIEDVVDSNSEYSDKWNEWRVQS